MSATSRANQFQIARHGIVVLLIGLLAGIGFSMAASSSPSLTSQRYETWHFAHLEGLLNGVVVLALAATWGFIENGRPYVRWGRWLLLIGAYANAIGPWITAVFIKHRVIHPHTVLEDFVVYCFYIPGVLPLVSVALFCWAIFAKRSDRSASPAPQEIINA